MAPERGTAGSVQGPEIVTNEVGNERLVIVQDRRHEQYQYLSGIRLVAVISSLCLGTFLMALDVNIIGTAIPHITTSFQSLDDVGWYGSAYLLTITAFQPVVGKMYSFFNVRLIYLTTVLIFEVGSVLCAAAPSSSVFILGRAVAGLGAAGLLQGALAIIGSAVNLERRPLFQGIVISVFGISICIGPVIGGAFTDGLSWRWCFWINLPIGAAAIILNVAFLRLRNTESVSRSLEVKAKIKMLDLPGTALFISGFTCLILALQWGGQSLAWSSSKVIGLLVGFGLLMIIFVILQWKLGEAALIPLRLFRQRSILCGTCFLFFFGILNYVYSFYLPFFVQAVQGSSAVTSGVRIIPLVLSQIIAIVVVGSIITQWGYYAPYMIFGQAVCAVGAGLLTMLRTRVSTVEWAAYLVVTGIGMGLSQQIPYTAIQVVLSEDDAILGNALAVFSNQLGGVISIPIAQSLLVNSLWASLSHSTDTPPPSRVISAGPSALNALAGGNESALEALRQAYAIGLRRTYILALAAGCAAWVGTLGMEWFNIKEEGLKRRTKGEKNSTSDSIQQSE